MKNFYNFLTQCARRTLFLHKTTLLLLVLFALFGVNESVWGVSQTKLNVNVSGNGTIKVNTSNSQPSDAWSSSTVSKQQYHGGFTVRATDTYYIWVNPNSGYRCTGVSDCSWNNSGYYTISFKGSTLLKNATKTVTATFVGNSYTISFAGNGATSGTMSNQSGFVYGKAKTLTNNAFERAYTVTYNADGGTCGTSSATATYTFDGWKSSDNTSYGNKASISTFSPTPSHNATVTLTAQWTSASVTLPTATKSGYVLEGWYKGDVNVPANKVGKAGDSYTPTANVTLNAKWIDKYTPSMTGANQTMMVDGEQENAFSFEDVDGPVAHITVKSISNVKKGDEVISYDAANNKIIAHNAGVAEIYFTQAETSTIKQGQSATYTYTVNKYTPTISVNRTDLELEQTATLTTTNTTSDLSVVINPAEGVLSYANGTFTATGLGDATVTVTQPEDYKTAPKQEVFNFHVSKKTSTLTVKMDGTAATSKSVTRGTKVAVTFVENSDADVVVTPVSGTQYASYVNGQMTAGAVGTATYRASLAETETFKAASVDFSLTVTAGEHLPYSNANGFTLGSESAVDWTPASRTIHFTGIPDKLSFNYAYHFDADFEIFGYKLGDPSLKCPSGLDWVIDDSKEGRNNVYMLYVEESADNSTWTRVWDNSTVNGKDNYVSSGAIQLKKTTRYVRFHHSCNFSNTYKNIQISELKYVDVADPNPATIDFGSEIINTGAVSKKALVNWCNVAPLTVTSTNPRFTVTPTSFGNFEEYATQELIIGFSHQEEGSFEGDITISNGDITKTIHVTAKTTRRPQTITWNSELVATGYAMNVGEQYPDEYITAIATVTSNGTITYTSDNSNVIEVIDNTKLLAKSVGTVNITARQAGDENYQAKSDTKQFTVTNLQKQSITWEQNLYGLLTTMASGDPIPLTATATSGLEITYASADESVVRVEGNTLIVVGEGETFVTATQAGSDDGNGVGWLPISQNNYVIVRDPASPCNGLALSQGSLTLNSSKTSQIYDLEGIPLVLTFTAKHGTKKTAWGTTPSYSNLIAEQYAYINNQLDWYEVYNQVVGTSDTQSGNITLDESAIKIRFRTLETGTDHTISNIRVTRPKEMHADISSVNQEAIETDATWTKTITVTHSNIDVMTVTTKQHLLIFNNTDYTTTLGSGCNDSGDDELVVSFTPTKKDTEYLDTIVISDEKPEPTVIEIPVRLRSKGWTQTIENFNLPATALTTDAITLNTTADGGTVRYEYSVPNIATVNANNELEILTSGEVTITAIQDGDDRYYTTSEAKTITISKVTPTIATNPTVTGVTYLGTYNNSQLSDGLAVVTLRGVENTPVAGTFVWSDYADGDSIKVAPGEHTYSVTFLPTNTAIYSEKTFTMPVTVNLAQSSIAMNDGEVVVSVQDNVVTLDLTDLIISQTGDGDVTYEVTSSNKGNATISGTLFSATEVDDYTIRATKAQTEYYTAAAVEFKVSVIEGITFGGDANGKWTEENSPSADDRVIVTANVDVVGNVAVGSLTINENNTVTIKKDGSLTVGDNNSLFRGAYGNIIVESGGKLILGEGEVHLNDFTLQSTFEDKEPISGQVFNQHEMIVHGNAYFILDIDSTGSTSYGWYKFSVPFPVDELRGITRWENNEWKTLTNEVNYAVMKYHEDLRAQGKYGWKKYTGILQPGVGYSITTDSDINRYRFQMVDAAAFDTCKTYNLVASDQGLERDLGWNSLGNNTMEYVSLKNAPGHVVQIYDHKANAYHSEDATLCKFVVGAAYFVQATENNSKLRVESPESNQTMLRAPQRLTDENDECRVSLSLMANGKKADVLVVTCDDEAQSTYTRGKDVQKMDATKTTTAHVWVNAKGTNLCAYNTAFSNNQAIIPLNIYVPAEGEYTLKLNYFPAEDVYLRRNGVIIWNMQMGDYTADFAAGTDNSYELLVIRRAPNTATGVDEIDSKNGNNGTIFVEKMIVDDQLYILREGILYDAQGRKVTNL